MSMIVVFGATGSTGVPLVRRLVSEGRAVRAAVRDVAKARGLLGDGVELVRADLERPATLPGALEGAAAVYCAVGGPTGTTDLVAAERALIDAARAARVGRYVKVSGVDASPEGKVLVRIVAQGQGYRVADFAEEVAALDRDGAVTREGRGGR